jgi:hypothetical protein
MVHPARPITRTGRFVLVSGDEERAADAEEGARESGTRVL